MNHTARTQHSSRPVGIRYLALAAVALFIVGCSCSKSEPAAKPGSAPTTTSTASTTPKPTLIAPLTGAPTTDLAAAKRPALAVKIDNAEPAARPQSGITEADVVYETRVEGSVTRFIAVFQSTGADPVGPVRSARMIDIPIISALSRPLFAWSGANAGVAAAIRSAPVIDVGGDAAPQAYARRGVGGKTAPHDFYSSTSALWALAPDDTEPPAPLFEYRSSGDALGAGARTVQEIHVNFASAASAAVDWRWDRSRKGFARWQKGTPHFDEHGSQVAPANVIVQFAEYHPNGDVDSGGGLVYEASQVGSGGCWLLTDAHIVDCLWSKDSDEAITKFTDTDGAPLKLTPGRTWVQLTPPGGADVVH